MSLAPQLYTPAEYLALERAADHRSEFYAGEIFAMAGASKEHSLIVGQVVRIIGNQLRGGPCRQYPQDMRVKVDETGLYTYPDVVVACGEHRFEDNAFDTLLNPTLIIEVLSPSTEAYDRGIKFQHYKKLESLQQYVLIAQDRASVEVFTRTESGDWLLKDAQSLTDGVSLGSIGADLPLAEVYENVEFPDEPLPPEPNRRRR
jgi:Uma2 family endonuclease